VKTQILPFYARKVEPQDGKFDYDVTGTVIGPLLAQTATTEVQALNPLETTLRAILPSLQTT
jgi:hypothetical protein